MEGSLCRVTRDFSHLFIWNHDRHYLSWRTFGDGCGLGSSPNFHGESSFFPIPRDRLWRFHHRALILTDLMFRRDLWCTIQSSCESSVTIIFILMTWSDLPRYISGGKTIIITRHLFHIDPTLGLCVGCCYDVRIFTCTHAKRWRVTLWCDGKDWRDDRKRLHDRSFHHFSIRFCGLYAHFESVATGCHREAGSTFWDRSGHDSKLPGRRFDNWRWLIFHILCVQMLLLF